MFTLLYIVNRTFHEQGRFHCAILTFILWLVNLKFTALSLSFTGSHWEQFCHARENVAKSINFGSRDIDRFRTWKKDTEKG